MIKNPEDIQPGCILFIRKNNSLISWLIRKLCHSDFSHVAVYSKNDKVIEADWRGVVKNSFSDKYLNNKSYYIEVVNLRLDFIQTQKFIEYLEAKLGSYYDYSLLFGHFLNRIFHISRRFLGFFNFEHNFICSELIAGGLKSIGIPIEWNAWQLNPEDLRQKLKRL